MEDLLSGCELPAIAYRAVTLTRIAQPIVSMRLITVMYGDAASTIGPAVVGARLYNWYQKIMIAMFWSKKKSANNISPTVKVDLIFLKLDPYSDRRIMISTVFAIANTAAAYNQISVIIYFHFSPDDLLSTLAQISSRIANSASMYGEMK